MADWIYHLAVGPAPLWLENVYSLLVPGIAGLATGLGAVVTSVVLEKPQAQNAMRVSILCALIYERSLARILRQVSADKLMTVLGRGLTAIEIGEKYKKLNKDAFIPGHFIRQYANKPVNDRMELRFEIEITHFPTPVFFLRRSLSLLGAGFRFLEADVPGEVATTWLIVRSVEGFAMLRRVPLGISLSELPEYFRGRDHEVEEDAWYGLLASFPVTE